MFNTSEKNKFKGREMSPSGFDYFMGQNTSRISKKTASSCKNISKIKVREYLIMYFLSHIQY